MCCHWRRLARPGAEQVQPRKIRIDSHPIAAWPFSELAVAASSSTIAAFCWVRLSISATEPLTCTRPPSSTGVALAGTQSDAGG